MIQRNSKSRQSGKNFAQKIYGFELKGDSGVGRKNNRNIIDIGVQL